MVDFNKTIQNITSDLTTTSVSDDLNKNSIKKDIFDKNKEINFDKDKASVIFSEETSFKSIRDDKLRFTNFFPEKNSYIEDDIFRETVTNSRDYLRRAKYSEFRMIKHEKHNVVNFESNEKKKLHKILMAIDEESNYKQDFEEGNIYKISPKNTDTSTSPIRFYVAYKMQIHDSDNIEYFIDIIFIDIYHLAIPSKYLFETSLEYEEKCFAIFKESNRSIFEEYNGL